MTLLPTAQQWENCGLIPTSGLFGWWMYEEGVSANNLIKDYSGNGRDLACSSTNAPVLSTGTGPNGQPSWYWDGSTSIPINFTGAVLAKHVFIIASHQDAAFNLNRGLLSGVGSSGGDIFTSNSSGTKFFDFGYGSGFEYRKSAILYTSSTMEAPMGGAFALLEGKAPSGIAMDGIQIGNQRNLARIWKGRFCELLVYINALSDTDVARIRLYANLKFAQWKVGLPFYFPSDDLMQFKRNRFYAEPPDWGKVTDEYEFEDGGKKFNEKASDAPRKWEYDYLGRTPQEMIIFDQFYSQARKANPFIFRDKDGVEWSNVHIDKYTKDHDKHKSWSQDAKFVLVKYPG